MNVKKIIFPILFLFLVTGCAGNSAAKNKVEKEILAVQTQELKTAELIPRELIQDSEFLNSAQKEKLLIIEEKSRNEHNRLTDEIERTKLVMIKTILMPKMDNKEFQILKKKLLQLDKQRLNSGLDSVTKARDIISPMEKLHQDQFNDVFFQHMFNGI